MVDEYLAWIRGIQYFARCGAEHLPGVEPCSGWNRAILTNADIKWENVLLEIANELSDAARAKSYDIYNEWNTFAEAVRPHAKQFVDSVVRAAVPVEAARDADSVLRTVRWILIHAYIETAYFMKHDIRFHKFRELMAVLESGHFPCGWDGEYPKGRLIVL